MTRPSQETSSARIAVLDGLRGVAVLLILINHVVAPLLPNEPGTFFAYGRVLLHLSYTGVDLFFVISGFFIGRELLKNYTAPNLARVFFLRRALRIVPLGFLLLGVVFLFRHLDLYRIHPDAIGRQPESPVVYLSFTSNLAMSIRNDWGYGPLALLWSLGVETQFYLLAPWLVRQAGPRRFAQLALGMIVFAFALRLSVFATHHSPLMAAHFLAPCRLDSFGFGFLAAWGLRSPAWLHSLDLQRARWWLAWLLLGAGLALMSKARVLPGGVRLGTLGYPCLAAFYTVSLLLIATAKKSSALHRFFGFPVLTGFGRYSYFIYLFQGTVTGLFFALFAGRPLAILPIENWLQAAAVFPLCYAAGWISWRVFESPLLGIGQRFHYKSPVPAP